MFVSNKIMKREEKKTYQWPKGRRMTSLGPSFIASPSSAVLLFSHFVAAPVPTPRAVAHGGGAGCQCGGCCCCCLFWVVCVLVGGGVIDSAVVDDAAVCFVIHSHCEAYVVY